VLSTQEIDPNARGKTHSAPVRWILEVWHLFFPHSQAQEDRQSERARLVAQSVLAFFCIGCVVSIFVFKKNIAGAYNSYRASGLMTRAQLSMDNGDYAAAFLDSQKAYSIHPDHTDAIRMNAEILTKASNATAIYFWDKLSNSGEAKLKDKCGRVLALYRIGRVKEAIQGLEELIQNNPADANLILIAEEIWGKRESQSKLIPALKSYVDKHPQDRASRLSLAALQCSSGVTADRYDGRKNLWDLAIEKDEISLKSLRQLGNLGQMDIGETARYQQLIESHPDANEDDHVLLLEQLVRASPHQKEIFIGETLAKISSKKIQKLTGFIRWLSVNNEHGRVLSMLTEQDVRNNQQLLSSYLNALSCLGRIDDLSRIVNDPRVIISVASRSFFRAHLAFIQQKPSSELKPLLENAVRSTESEGLTDMLLSIGTYAEDRGMYDISEDAFKVATKNPKIERKAFTGLIRVASKNGHTDVLYEGAREAAKRWPDSQEFQEAALYSSLLLGLNVETCVPRAEKLLQANEKDPQCRLLNAMISWRLGDFQSMAGYCQNIDVTNLTNGERSVLGCIIKDGGYTPAANRVFSHVNISSVMLPEEKQFFYRAQTP
jgi:tetratricopeptide (TPR) repeat protein